MDAYRSDDRPDLTRRAALAGAAALGGAGIASMVGAEKAFAATSEYFINAIDYGVVGNGIANDTTALQEAIDASIASGKPLYLPPGRYRTTAGLKAEASNFAIFGAGGRLSMIVPDESSYDALTIGPGEEGSGNSPSGYARDFGFEGGNADWDAAGTEPDTGKAAFKLDGMREFEVTNVNVEADSAFDIGFDLVNNSHGNTFHNCRTGFNGCRVGINIRNGSGDGTGSDVTFFNSWLFGEVAAVQIGDFGGGYHFYGGQFTSSWQSGANTDGRGSLILGKDYLTGALGRAATCTFDGIDFEGQQRCWIVRAFDEISATIKDCQFNGSGSNKTIGVFKSSAFKNGKLQLIDNRITGKYSNTAAGMLVLESAFDGALVFDVGGSGQALVAPGETEINFDDVTLTGFAQDAHGVAIAPKYIQMNDLFFRVGLPEGGKPLTFEISENWGSSWRAVSLGAKTVASAATISVPDGLSLVLISGTTGIKTINATSAGHVVTLKFAGALTVTDGSNLKLAGNFTTTADDTLQLVCDGTNWFEVGRSAN